MSWRRTLIRPLCYSFHPSPCLLAPSFVPTLFLRSPITLYLSILLSFTRVSLPSFCRSHVLVSHHSPPPLHALRCSLHPSLLPPFFTLLPLFPPSFFCHPPCNHDLERSF